MSGRTRDVDVVVIGGGPAGSTVSTLIAQRGYRVRLFERDRFPRFHVGESLIPETYWVLKRLGMLPKMHASRFVKKYSVQFFTGSGRPSAPFYFWENKPHEASQTWQVVRSEFDQMMLENAREHGVDAHEGVRVLDVIFEDGRACGVSVKAEDGTFHEVRARVVVDASGQNGLLQHKLRLRIWDPVLAKGSIWAYWEGARRDAGRDEGATLVIQTPDRTGWFWYVPLHDNVVSVGVVGPYETLLKGRPAIGATYDAEVARCVPVRERVSSGRRVTGYFATKDFSYRARRLAGDGWVMIGDAFGFLDPLYSSGVLLALKSGELAADAICEGFEKRDLSAAQLGHWEGAFNRGIDRMRRLVCEYYDGFSFGRFVKAFPHLQGPVTDLLIGDLFNDRVDQVWEAMDSLYPAGRAPIPSWDAGLPVHESEHKDLQLTLPDGRKP